MDSAECSLNIDDHLHCLYCYKLGCGYDKCKLITCSECDIRLHPCKLDDHLIICPKVRVNCPNVLGGCPVVMRRDRISSHLKHCCASVTLCAIQWNRRILSNSAKRKMKRIAKQLDKLSSDRPFVDSSQIDIHLAIRDQDMLLESYRIKRSERKRLLDFINPFHPVMPPRIQFEPQKSFVDEDSSDEETILKKKLLKKRKSPFENCYLCKIDPTSQHLHTLGNFMEPKEEEVDIKIPIKVSVMPTFYERLNLYIDIVSEHLSAYARKGENMQCFGSGITVYTFCCNEMFRRDEYSDHYELCHMNMDEYIGRCPLYADGCPFSYYKRKPKWGTLRFNQYLSCIVHVPTECPTESRIEIPYKGLSLSDLPADVLYEILKYLDSGSLRCLSATNRRLRRVCFENFASSAMVYVKWEQSETRHWSEKCFAWEFSKGQQKISDWQYESSSVVSEHLKECQFNIINKCRRGKIPLPCFPEA
ncbi:unnamed protein product [Anisakis simplex]|uniref:F-box only protein 30 n=1 Tax=Anisakis simplex TaxID=6269 RepID=A0A0M3JSP7_ANISI|nr:unnamed protein product [Anisakis simplex]